MLTLTKEDIKSYIADSHIIFQRGERIFSYGNYYLKHADYEKEKFHYFFDGNYGDYDVIIRLDKGSVIDYSCNCPYPGDGCKHSVAACLDILDKIEQKETQAERAAPVETAEQDQILSPEEIRLQAIENRKKSSKEESYDITFGDTLKGEHLVVTQQGREYVVIIHDPVSSSGTCTCPDYSSNRLGTCKHLIHLATKLKQQDDYQKIIEKEIFPFVHLYWDSKIEKPRIYYENKLPEELEKLFASYFNSEGHYIKDTLDQLFPLLQEVKHFKQVRVEEAILAKIDTALFEKEAEQLKKEFTPSFSAIKTTPYPYQEKGVLFTLFKRSAIIADEMGLGKTLQAITAAVLKKDIFNIEKVLIICPASLKEQWKREIEKFTSEKAVLVSGTKQQRQHMYQHVQSFFKITNYEAVLRDVMVINRFKPDLIILDEAQRIKNFETKTSQAIKSIPHKQSLVLTGTPLENKLEDVYSIVQFADRELLTPLWSFAAEHFVLKRNKKNKIFGYKNLNTLHEKLQSLVIRRKKQEVIDELPEEIVNNYYIEMTDMQRQIHQGYLASLIPLVNKKFLTPMDMRRIQELLMSMRMVCNSTFLIDRKTHISPKLKELEGIVNDIVIENRRKVVIFSEWTTMTFLIGKVLSQMGINFIELSGKVPVNKRQKLIDEFTTNPDCMVFLSTDAGGVGLNLQVADCVINFELPWNPARLNQRIGRVSRIGQKSSCINVINFITKESIEEKILAGIHLKQELFDGVFEGTVDEVEFSQAKKAEFINKIKAMLGDKPIPVPHEPGESEELPESTPHYLNPRVLAEQGPDISAEEDMESIQEVESPSFTAERVYAPEKAEKMKEVMETGVHFLSELMEVATGKPLVVDDKEKLITIDQETGEVTLKFRLPGLQRT
jgi:SNF2 family DNA or RNA helicase